MQLLHVVEAPLISSSIIADVKAPDAVEKEDMDQLHDLGWTDSDIMDALAHGTNMIGSSILMKTFKMD